MGKGFATSRSQYAAEDLSTPLEQWLKKVMLAVNAVFVVYLAVLFFLTR
jgi:hypothetical protein